ncbi:RES domain-containing protein [Akkermansiaceae bacterium]|nr:RES domain-containing protein [Akkermansiaceae bacterium]
MAVFYRIVGKHRAATAMDGEAARKMGGRWNPQGVPAAYLTESRALAALEILVHAGWDAVRLPWVVITVDVPGEITDSATPRNLPAGWDDLESPSPSRNFGAGWLERSASAAILLPSAIIPEERILMVNVRHPDFVKIKISQPQPFHFDRRSG